MQDVGLILIITNVIVFTYIIYFYINLTRSKNESKKYEK